MLCGRLCGPGQRIGRMRTHFRDRIAGPRAWRPGSPRCSFRPMGRSRAYCGCVDDTAGKSARFLLIRHAEAAYETDGNGDSGGSLTSVGRDQARRLGQRLKPLRPSFIICSEISRAVQTAEIAASVLSVPVEVRLGLEEYHVGDERGRPYKASLMEPLLQDWLHGRLSSGIPGGEDGHAVARRVMSVLDDAVVRAGDQTIAVVSHGGAINSIIGRLSPGTSELSYDALEVPPCGMVVLTLRAGEWHISGSECG